MAAHEVRTDGHVLYYEIVRPEAPNRTTSRSSPNEERKEPERRSRYALHLPYTIVGHRLGQGSEGCSTSSPRSRCARTGARDTSGSARNYNLDQPDGVLREFEDVIFGQDKRVVESQRPEQVPFDLADELHLRFDAVAVAYRRAMRAEGARGGGPGRAGTVEYGPGA